MLNHCLTATPSGDMRNNSPVGGSTPQTSLTWKQAPFGLSKLPLDLVNPKSSWAVWNEGCLKKGLSAKEGIWRLKKLTEETGDCAGNWPFKPMNE